MCLAHRKTLWVMSDRLASTMGPGFSFLPRWHVAKADRQALPSPAHQVGRPSRPAVPVKRECRARVATKRPRADETRASRAVQSPQRERVQAYRARAVLDSRAVCRAGTRRAVGPRESGPTVALSKAAPRQMESGRFPAVKAWDVVRLRHRCGRRPSSQRKTLRSRPAVQGPLPRAASRRPLRLAEWPPSQAVMTTS